MFRIKDGRENFFQWDLNRKLIVEDKTITEVHFYNDTVVESLPVAVVNQEVNVPNLLLKEYGTIKAYAFINDYTKVEESFNVIKKVKPSDYEYTETETVNWKTINDKVDEAKASAESAKKSEVSAKESENQSSQNLADTLAAIGTSIASLVGGKIPMSQIPATATTEIYVVSSKDELTGLTAQKGDLAELVEDVEGERTITKTWQLLNNEPTNLDSWVVWGTSYAVQSGSSTIAESAGDSERINGMRFVTMNYSDFESAIKDDNTLYAVDMGA